MLTNYAHISTSSSPGSGYVVQTTLGYGHPSAITATHQYLTYTYDQVGNVKTITDALWTGGRSFDYDDLNRMTQASGTFGTNQAQVTQGYVYDAIGNILLKAGVSYCYGYMAGCTDSNHLSAVKTTSDGATYTYDANGNITSGAGRTYTWTWDNRLDVANGPGGSAVMSYDYTGIRIKKSGSSGTTYFPFTGYEVQGGTVTKYIRIGNEIIASKQGASTKRFYHSDHLGGVNIISDATGSQVQLTEYDPWGKISRSSGNVDPSHRFTGQELDTESNVHYYGGRYYDQGLGRFVSADIIVPLPRAPQNLNRYAYVLNSPQNFNDPTGHFWNYISSAFKLATAYTFFEVAPVYSILSGISGVAGVIPGKTAAKISSYTGYAALGSQVVAGFYDRLTGADVGDLIETASGKHLDNATGLKSIGVPGVYNWTDTNAIQFGNDALVDAVRLNKSSGPIADLIKAGLSNFGITGPLGDVIATDIRQAMPTLKYIAFHSAGTGLGGSVLDRPEFAGALQGVEVWFHAPIISRAAASAIGTYTGATPHWNGSPLDAVTYLGRPFYMAPVGILVAPLLPWTHPCSIACPVR